MKKYLLVMLSFGYVFNTYSVQLPLSQYQRELKLAGRFRGPLEKISRDQVPYTQPERIHELYQMMKDIHEIFEAYGLRYWIEGGTLLGAVRHKGLIPWDNDLDISVELKDKSKFEAIIPLLTKLDFIVQENLNHGYQIFTKNYTLCDIFFWHIESEKYIYSYSNAYSWWPHMYYTEDLLFPLKKYVFGPLELWGPQNEHFYCDHLYGEEWRSQAIFQKPAHDGWYNFVLELADEDKLPAVPLGPLENRVEKFFETN